MKVSTLGALAGAVIMVAGLAPAGAAQAQGRDRIVRSLEIARGTRIGASMSFDEAADSKDAKAGVVFDTVTPGGPADKAGIKAGDAVTEFDGERVRSVRQFLRLVQEAVPGRSVPVVLSRSGQPVAVNVTPERGSSGDDFDMQFFDTPMARLAVPRPVPPTPPAPPRAPRPPSILTPAMPFEFFGRLGRGRLGITMEDLDSQLAEYFGVKDGVLVKSVAADSVAAKAGLKAGDVITAFNGRHVYDSSDVTRALDRTESDGDVTIEVMRDKKTVTLKGKLESPDTRLRTRVRTNV